MVISFTVPGEPYGKPRPRVTKYGTYNPEKCGMYEELTQLRYREAAAAKGWKGFTGAVNIKIQANFGIPVRWNKARKQAARDGTERPTKKPDCDNISKVILDALNETAFKDDAYVVGLMVQKRYVTQIWQEPSVYVEIEEVSTDE